ncbi:MAG: PucR family transcriptional regulator ligand-binding domain-containing protein [Chloroflexi bacterium]|nr:PucR family transcriptional regulator ligand-binding domain-containing protein [Chloroflexota bacterium]
MSGVPLRDALALPALRNARVLAGAAGLGHAVRYVNVMEVPDIIDWVKPDELLLTTAYPLRDDRAGLADLVPRLADRGLAGLAVKPARYLEAVPQVMLAAADKLGFPVLELPPETALADIINAVLGLILNAQAQRLERSAAVHERFTAIVLRGGGLREIVQTLADLLERPAAILDAHGALLARSPTFPNLPEAVFTSLDAHPSAGLRWGDVVSGSGQVRVGVQPIQAGHERHGMAVVLADENDLAEDQLMALEQAATIAALRLVQARAVAEADRRFQAVCLDELVTGHVADAAVLRERATAFGWDLTVPRAVVVAEIDSLGDRRFGELAGTSEEGWACRRVADAARSVLGRDAIVWERSAGAAALTGGLNLRTDAEALQAEAARRLPGAIISIGVGRLQPDPLDLQLSYSEALRSLQVGRRGGGPGVVSLFADLGLDRLLMSCAPAELETFFTATLDPMLSYERAHPGCGLTATLQAFLAADRNVAETARALFVHYNTVKYRLERLERMLGAFIDFPERCLTLEVAMHVGRLITRAAP